MAFEEQLPEWQNEGTQPPQSKRVEGWLPNEKPPASWFNWLFHRAYKALQELQQKAGEKEAVEQAQQTAANAQSDIDAHLASSTPHANLLGVEDFGFNAPTILTISNGAITPTQSFHYVDTEGGASTDELENINGGNVGDVLLLAQTASNRNITIRHGTGNIRVLGGTDIEFGGNTGTTGVIMFVKYNSQVWYAVGIQGVKRSGDTMTGDLQLQGTNVLLRLPETAPTWARGLYLRDQANEQSIASFGFYGTGSNFERLFFGIGENPWSINSVGVWLRPDGRLSYVNSGTEHSLWHAGNLPVESGNWTVTLSGQTTPGTPTYSTRIGRYYRVGRLVHIYFACVISNKGGMSGRLVLGGLPFLAATGSGGIQSVTINVMNVTYPENAREVFGGLSSSEPNIIFAFRASDGSLIVVDTSHIDDSFEIRGSATYLID